MSQSAGCSSGRGAGEPHHHAVVAPPSPHYAGPYAGAIWTAEVLQTVCDGNSGVFSTQHCGGTQPDDESLERLGCCYATSAYSRTCYYGAQGSSTTVYESICQNLGCRFEPG